MDRHGRPEIEITGTDTYSLLPGGNWITHDVDVMMGAQHALAHELIGGSHPDGGWLMYAFDGSTEPGLMRLSVQDSTLLLLEGDGIRSWLHFGTDGDHMAARWERSDGENWTTWMSMQFDR